MSEEKLMHLFQKYAGKTCTKDEYAEFMAFVDQENTNGELDHLMNSEWESHIEGPIMDKMKATEIFDEVLAAGSFDKSFVSGKSIDVEKTVSLKVYWKWAIGVAASVALAVSALSYYTPKESGQNKEIVSVKRAVRPNVNVKAVDEHRKIELPDGSVVILNNESTLEFPTQFAVNDREVVLKGEAYFDIKHDSNKPFIVHTGKISTTVLGTAFNIKAYDTETNVIVTVTRGKVMVQNEKEMLGVLLPNQQIIFNKDQQKSMLASVVAKRTIEWQENDLYFNDVTMEEAAMQLAKRFKVKITFANDNSKGCRFTATFLKGEGLNEILDVITSFNHIEYKTKPDEIVISGNGCK